MSIKSKMKRAGGFAEEELGEKLDKPGLAQKGRNLRNEGRMEEGMLPKMTKPGSGHKE